LTAIMRKLLLLANALLKANRHRTQRTADQYGSSSCGFLTE
jgi:hypothetical protein